MIKTKKRNKQRVTFSRLKSVFISQSRSLHFLSFVNEKAIWGLVYSIIFTSYLCNVPTNKLFDTFLNFFSLLTKIIYAPVMLLIG